MSTISAFFQDGYAQRSATGCAIIYMSPEGQILQNETLAPSSCGNEVQSNGLPILDSLLQYRNRSRTIPSPANGFNVLGMRKGSTTDLVIQSRRDNRTKYIATPGNNNKWTGYYVAENTPFDPIGTATKDGIPIAQWLQNIADAAKVSNSSESESWPTWIKIVAAATIGIAIFFLIKKILS